MAWWQEAVVYELYVRSFRDADGDGVGDLAGVLEKLGYLAELGVDAVWLTPIHPSPDADVGYDVVDYEAVDPRLGTFEDVDRLLRAAHGHGIRVLLDLVVNHASERHPWFTASRASRQDRRRDWYIWRAGRPDAPPTNWRSLAGGSAWQYDAATDEHYLHTFLPEQPDLNWRKADVRAAIADAMRFRLDRGVDGFRLDALPLLVKDAQFRDNPPNPRCRPGQSDYRRLLARAHGRSARDGRGRRVPADGRRRVSGSRAVRRDGPPAGARETLLAPIHVPFNFGLITEPWTAPRLAHRIAAHLDALPAGASPNWVLGNHDIHRPATRVGPARASRGAGRPHAAGNADALLRRRARPAEQPAAAGRTARRLRAPQPRPLA